MKSLPLNLIRLLALGYAAVVRASVPICNPTTVGSPGLIAADDTKALQGTSMVVEVLANDYIPPNTTFMMTTGACTNGGTVTVQGSGMLRTVVYKPGPTRRARPVRLHTERRRAYARFSTRRHPGVVVRDRNRRVQRVALRVRIHRLSRNRHPRHPLDLGVKQPSDHLRLEQDESHLQCERDVFSRGQSQLFERGDDQQRRDHRKTTIDRQEHIQDQKLRSPMRSARSTAPVAMASAIPWRSHSIPMFPGRP